MSLIHIDFETRSEVDIKKTTSQVYAEHPSTEVLCVVANDRLSQKTVIWHPLSDESLDMVVRKIEDPNTLFKAHNAGFEICIWHEIMHKRFGFPSIPLGKWSCTAAKAAAHSLPRPLDKCGQALGLRELKDQAGKRVMMKMSSPRKATKHNKDKYHWSEEDFQSLINYCIDDTNAEAAIDEFLPQIRGNERVVWLADQRINARGAKLDMEAVEAACILIDNYLNQINGELADLTDGYVSTIGQVAKITDYIANYDGVQIPDLKAPTIKEYLKKEDIPERTKRILQIRQEGSKASVKKYPAMKRCVGKNGRVNGLHTYWGANTGRWAGKYVQTQNLPRGNLATSEEMESAVAAIKTGDPEKVAEIMPPMDLLSSAIRGMIVPEEGHVFYVGDWSAIEARILLWLAGDEHGLDIFRKGEDIYIDMAIDIYNNPNLTKENSEERRMGKQAILGLGYQMGVDKFMDTCLGYGIELDKSFSERVVNVYRDKYRNVKELWYGLEEAAVAAIETDQRVKCSFVTFYVEGNFLFAELPSKRRIAYSNPTISMEQTPWGQMKPKIQFMGTDSTKGGRWTKQTTYGGKLTENVVQGIARDILAEAIVRCERGNRFPIVLHVHDEIITEVKRGTRSLEEFKSLVSELPAWAEGLPMEFEVWEGERYRK